MNVAVSSVCSFYLNVVLFSEGLFQEIVTLAEKCFEVELVLAVNNSLSKGQ